MIHLPRPVMGDWTFGRESSQPRQERRAPRQRGRLASALVVSALVVACGGSSPTPTDDAVTSTGAAGNEPVAEQPSPEAATGGSFRGSACDLLTPAEVEAASGQPNVEAQPSEAGSFDGQSQCAFVSGGLLPVMIVTVAGPDTSTDMTGYLALPESVRLPVNGADAAFVPAAGFMTFVIKHGLVVAYVVTAPAEGKEFQEVAAALVQPVADRMP